MTLIQTAKTERHRANDLADRCAGTDRLQADKVARDAQPTAMELDAQQTSSSEHCLSGYGCLMTYDLMSRLRFLLSRRVVLTAIAASVVFEGYRISAAGSATSVLVIPSIHKRLAGNSRYSYADLYSLVAAFQPNLVEVEIRQEDLASPGAYLHHNYPEEMVATCPSI